jgi:hypothetical protein
MLVVATCVAALPYASSVTWGLFDDTVVTIRNDSGQNCSFWATVVDVERGEGESDHRYTLPAGGSATIEVQHGIKRIDYIVNGNEGTISFDMRHGQEVVLAINRDETLRRVVEAIERDHSVVLNSWNL